MADISTKKLAKSKPKTALKANRAWRVITGPEVSEINLRIPLDAGLAERQVKQGTAVDEHLRKAARKAVFKRTTPPVNIGGGYKFPNAPIIDLSPEVEAAASATAAPVSRVDLLIPDDLSIPEFLKRPLPAAPRPAAEEAPAPTDAPAAQGRTMKEAGL